LINEAIRQLTYDPITSFEPLKPWQSYKKHERSSDRAVVPVQKWAAGGIDALRLPWKDIGLAYNWLDVFIKQIGSYCDLFEKILGARSPYKLPSSVNAQVPSGSLLLAGFDE